MGRTPVFDFEGPPWSWSYGNWIYNYLYNQSLSRTTKVVGSKPAHGEVYSIHHYGIKFPPPKNWPHKWLAATT